MKKDREEIVVELNNNEHASVKKLSKEDQEQIKKLSEQIKKELTEEDKQRKNASRSIRRAKDVASSSDEKPDMLTDNYADFYKQYGKTENADFSKFGKYNSDLDFKLNRKIRKVHLPMSKKKKIMFSSIAAAAAVILVAVLAVVLYKPPAAITITSMALTQRTVNGEYVVDGNYVGEKLSLDYIYIVCNYSNGETKKVPLTDSMVTSKTGLDTKGCFTNQDATVNISYQGQTLKLKFLVEQRVATSIEFIQSSTLKHDGVSITLKNKLIGIVTYDNGDKMRIDLDKCTYDIGGATGKTCSNGIIKGLNLTPSTTYMMVIHYEGLDSNTIEVRSI